MKGNISHRFWGVGYGHLWGRRWHYFAYYTIFWHVLVLTMANINSSESISVFTFLWGIPQIFLAMLIISSINFLWHLLVLPHFVTLSLVLLMVFANLNIYFVILSFPPRDCEFLRKFMHLLYSSQHLPTAVYIQADQYYLKYYIRGSFWGKEV